MEYTESQKSAIRDVLLELLDFEEETGQTFSEWIDTIQNNRKVLKIAQKYGVTFSEDIYKKLERSINND
jgi:hypothetical protein